MRTRMRRAISNRLHNRTCVIHLNENRTFYTTETLFKKDKLHNQHGIWSSHFIICYIYIMPFVLTNPGESTIGSLSILLVLTLCFWTLQWWEETSRICVFADHDKIKRSRFMFIIIENTKSSWPPSSSSLLDMHDVFIESQQQYVLRLLQLVWPLCPSIDCRPSMPLSSASLSFQGGSSLCHATSEIPIAQLSILE